MRQLGRGCGCPGAARCQAGAQSTGGIPSDGFYTGALRASNASCCCCSRKLSREEELVLAPDASDVDLPIQGILILPWASSATMAP